MPDNTKSMFDAYRKGKVKQHSVVMRYRALDFAVNDDSYPEEFAIWEKYFEDIANKEDALDNGFFWAVTQAQNIEGSAVVRGSNFATPTLHVEAKVDQLQDIPHDQVKTILSASDLLKNYQPQKFEKSMNENELKKLLEGIAEKNGQDHQRSCARAMDGTTEGMMKN